MKDSHWLSAIERYDNNDHRRFNRDANRDSIGGGARELAGQLQQVTKKDPTRFSALCLKIPYTAHHTYIEHILWGLAEADAPSDELLIQVVKYAHQHPDKPFGSGISRLLTSHPHISADVEILEILIWYALNGEANESFNAENTEHETMSIEALMRRGKSYHTCGCTDVRSEAWGALGAVLWKIPSTENQVWNTIKIGLEKEALLSVRCCMIKAIEPLFNMNKQRFVDAILRLIVLPNGSQHQNDSMRFSPLITYTAIHLFPYIFYWLPDLAAELVNQLLQCGDETKELIGAWLIFGESFRNEAYIEKADKLVAVSANHRRLMAGITAKVITWAENRHRAEALLKQFFYDDDLEVRRHAALVFSNIKPEDVESYLELAKVFLKSPALDADSFHFFHMLEDATCNVLDLVLEATQCIIQSITKNEKQQHRRDQDLYTLQDIIKREYTSSESNPKARGKLLDLIDAMLSHEIYGVDSVVTAHDRW